MYWDSETLDEARAKMWNPEDWDRGVAHCLSMLEDHLTYGGLILEYGCGIGRLMKPLARRHYRTRFIGYDISDNLLDLAKTDARDNEVYLSSLFVSPWLEFRSAYSVITFQHIGDDAVLAALTTLYPIPLRFQFAIGEEKTDLNYQRDPAEMRALCAQAGYEDIEISEDPLFPTWRWVSA
jgi:SAM-dependent methyltransferase